MKKSLSIVLVLIMAAALLVCPALAAGDGTGGGTKPLTVVSVTIDGVDLSGAEADSEGAITVTFSNGMANNSEVTKTLIVIKNAAGENVGAAVSYDPAVKSDFVVSFSGLEAGAYTLVIGKDAQANNGTTLGEDYEVRFTVKAADVDDPVDDDPVDDNPVDDLPDVPDDSTAPQTGESSAVFAVAALALLGVFGAAYGLKKVTD